MRLASRDGRLDCLNTAAALAEYFLGRKTKEGRNQARRISLPVEGSMSQRLMAGLKEPSQVV